MEKKKVFQTNVLEMMDIHIQNTHTQEMQMQTLNFSQKLTKNRS